jgi:hypothetical protein
MSKVLLAIAVAAVLGLTGFLLWWFMFRNGSKSSGRIKEYMLPMKENVDKRILKEKEKTREGADSAVVPKVVYATYHDIDLVPHRVIEDLKRYCHGYKVEVCGYRSCEDFLYKYYGPDVMQLFRELDPSKKSRLWALCRLYVDGGYYLDIRRKFDGHVSNLPSSTKTVNISHKGQDLVALSAKPKAPELWSLIERHFPNTGNNPQEIHIAEYDAPSQVRRDFPLGFRSGVDELIYRHRNLPDVDPQKVDLPVLYINMDKHKERRKSMEEQLKGVTSVTRIPGVLVTDKKHQPLPPSGITKGELGCFMAHRNAWQTFMDNEDWEKVLILEDDAALRLSSRWRRRLSELQTPVFLAQGGTAYILDRKTGKYLLDRLNKRPIFDIPVDSWMWKMLETNEYSREQVGFSSDTARKCDTLYYIYTYNAEEEVPTAITDRRYGTDVRDHYAEIAVNLIKKSTLGIDLLTIDPQGAVVQNIGTPVIAILDFHDGNTFFDSLLDMYDNRFRVEVYTKEVLGPSYRNKKRDHIKFFDLDYSSIHEEVFNKIIKSEHCDFVVKDEFKAINLGRVVNATYSVDCHGFPTSRGTKGRLPSCFSGRHVEEGERHVASVFTKPNACVLELGGGSGAVSVIVQQMLKNKSNHVVVQPEKGVDGETPMFGGIANLSKNKEACQCEYHIIDHVLEVGEGKEIQRLVSKPFDTLVVDCEGCLVKEYRKNPGLFSHVTMVQVERDDTIIEGSESYDPLLTDLGFSKIHDGVGCDGRCPTEVWVRSLEASSNDYPTFPKGLSCTPGVQEAHVDRGVTVLTYADDRFGRKGGGYKSTQLFIRETLHYHPDVKEVVTLDEKDLFNSALYREFKDWYDRPLHSGGAGNGFKPFFMLEVLARMSDGDYLLWHDSSPEIWDRNKDYTKIRLKELMSICTQNRGILVPAWPDLLGDKHTHEMMTSPQCMDIMRVNRYIKSPQWCTSWVLVQKSEYVARLMKEWMHFMTKEECASVDYSKEENRSANPKFVEHRYDQSVLTLLMLREGLGYVQTEGKCIFDNAIPKLVHST